MRKASASVRAAKAGRGSAAAASEAIASEGAVSNAAGAGAASTTGVACTGQDGSGAGCGGGAALLCEHMLAHGEAGATPRHSGVQFAPGLGLTNRVVIDQGGHASDRLGRLLSALALNPFALGLGIDAATAAIIGPDNVLEVVGAGGVTVLDPSEMAESNVADLAPGTPIRITNLRLHALTGGARYDLDFRRGL